jgi:hypothetical protein
MSGGHGGQLDEGIAAYFAQKKPIKAICREFRLSRKVVRKVLSRRQHRFESGGGHQFFPKPLKSNWLSAAIKALAGGVGFPRG